MIRVCSQQGAVFIYRYFPISKVSIFWYMFLVTTKNTLNSINRTKSKETDFDLHKIGFFDIGRDDRIRTSVMLFLTNPLFKPFFEFSPLQSRFSFLLNGKYFWKLHWILIKNSTMQHEMQHESARIHTTESHCKEF